MKRIFVDTSAWDAIADKGDKNHARALQFRDEITGRYVLQTSDYILDELYTLLLMNVGYQQTIRFKSKNGFKPKTLTTRSYPQRLQHLNRKQPHHADASFGKSRNTLDSHSSPIF